MRFFCSISTVALLAGTMALAATKAGWLKKFSANTYPALTSTRFHRSKSALISIEISIFYPQEERDAGKPERELATAEEQGRFEDEGWRLRKDGTRFWANVVIAAIRDSQGNLLGFSKVTKDVSTRYILCTVRCE